MEKRYHRYAHLSEVRTDIEIGKRVKKGDFIGRLGNTGNSTTAHLHYDVLKTIKKLTNFHQYTSKNQTKDKVLERYTDPREYITNLLPTQYDHLGWNFLENIGGGQLHPGIDINGLGGGNADLGNEVFATTDGVFAYFFDQGTDKKNSNNGWGNMIVIEEDKPEPIKQKPVEQPFIKKTINTIMKQPIGAPKSEARKNIESTAFAFLYLALPQILLYVANGITESDLDGNWRSSAVIIGVIANALTKYYLHDIKK